MSFDPALDPRFQLARPDLAELALEGLVAAAAYRATEPRQCALGWAPITDDAGEAVAEILYGEIFDVLETRDGQCWGRARRDGSVGHVDADLLRPIGSAPTARIANVEEPYPMNALVGPEDGVDPANLADFHTFDADPAVAAERLVGGRYRKGGRARGGLDAFGLVQQALFACGRSGPRAGDLLAGIGEAVQTPRRGDLAIWVGFHAGVFISEAALAHACPDAGRVVVEPFTQIDARWRESGAVQATIRRP